MNAGKESILGHVPVTAGASSVSSSTHALATVMLAAGVAALVVIADQMIDSWAQTHVAAAWLALWAVAALAIGLLRGLSRAMAHQLMKVLDAWSAQVASRRADERLWVMAQSDPRLMSDLQVALDVGANDATPPRDLETLMTRRAARLVRDRLYYI